MPEPISVFLPQLKKNRDAFLQRSHPSRKDPINFLQVFSREEQENLRSGKGRLLTRCQVPNDSQSHHQDDTCVPDRRRRRHSHQHTPMNKGAFIAPFASDQMGHRTSLIHQVLSGSELFL